ncbi:CWC16 protein [Xylariaceae sp. FL0016]|nr:CWC16 protein [Xylariaceae sp. FL0016]
MSERKVLQKYYPPDFDHSAIARKRGPKQVGPKVQTVRLMAPFSMKCTSCGEYIYKGRKFNARKETPQGEAYLGIQIFRFYIKCTRCSSEITFLTDPRIADYKCERGAVRSTEPWRVNVREETDEERLDRLEAEQAEEEDGERNAMSELEAKTVDAKREMAVADALDEIRTRNARLERADKEGVETSVAAPVDDEAERLEREDAERARKAFASARKAEAQGEEIVEPEASTTAAEGASGSTSASAGSSKAVDVGPKTASEAMPPPSFKRVVKKKKDHSALLGIKKKPSLV